jgi:hypothetical protein
MNNETQVQLTFVHVILYIHNAISQHAKFIPYARLQHALSRRHLDGGDAQVHLNLGTDRV